MIKLMAAAAAVLWGFTYVLTTTWLPSNPMFLAAARALGAGVLLLLITRCVPPRSWWWRLLVLGTLNAGLFFGLFFIAAVRLPGGVAAIFQALMPLAVILLAWGVLGAKPTTSKVVAVVMGAVGVTLVVLSSSATLDAWGIAAALGSVLSLSVAAVLMNKWGKPPMSMLGFTGWQMLVAGLELTVVTLLMQDVPASLDSTHLMGLVLLAVALTAIPFAFWFTAIEHAGAVTVAPFMLLVPVTAFVLDAMIKHTTPTPLQLVGAALVMAGLVLSQRKSQAPALPHAKSPAHVVVGESRAVVPAQS